jgi:hypothetical protein
VADVTILSKANQTDGKGQLDGALHLGRRLVYKFKYSIALNPTIKESLLTSAYLLH